MSKINLPSQVSQYIHKHPKVFFHAVKNILPRRRGDETKTEINRALQTALKITDTVEKQEKLQSILERLDSEGFKKDETAKNIIQICSKVDPLLAKEIAKFDNTLIQILAEDDPDKRYEQDIKYLQETIMKQRIVVKDKKAEKTNTEEKEQKEHHGNLFITKEGYLAEITKKGRKLVQNSEQQNIKVEQHPYLDNIIIKTCNGKKTISRVHRDKEGNIAYKDIEGAKGLTKIQHIQGSSFVLIQGSDKKLQMIDLSRKEGEKENKPVDIDNIININYPIVGHKLQDRRYIQHTTNSQKEGLSLIEQNDDEVNIKLILEGYTITPITNQRRIVNNHTGIAIIETLNDKNERNISLIFPDGTVNRDIIDNPNNSHIEYEVEGNILKISINENSVSIPLDEESKIQKYLLPSEKKGIRSWFGNL